LRDYDGAEITATTHIEEREWKRGEKWCSWLSLFYRPMIRRSLDIDYSAEVGPRKGSWKGGTIGCSINMLPGELHDDAFIRHCVKEGLTYMGRMPMSNTGEALARRLRNVERTAMAHLGLAIQNAELRFSTATRAGQEARTLKEDNGSTTMNH
jgi:hypothetical protein